MKKGTIVLLSVVGLVLMLFVGACSSYNSMVNKQENTERAWATVQSAYQRRLDLIPNLVATVKGAANYISLKFLPDAVTLQFYRQFDGFDSPFKRIHLCGDSGI